MNLQRRLKIMHPEASVIDMASFFHCVTSLACTFRQGSSSKIELRQRKPTDTFMEDATLLLDK